MSSTSSVAGPVTIPVQKQSVDQLRSGLHVRVLDDRAATKAMQKADPKNPPAKLPPATPLGDSWGDVAVGRVVQNAADFMASTAGVSPSLAKVIINDHEADGMAASGYAEFSNSHRGEFHLSPSTTTDLIAGIKRLRTEPLATWSTVDAMNFIDANSVLLHESDHITLRRYDDTNIDAAFYHPKTRDMEEGLTELAAAGRLPAFIRQQYGQDAPAEAMDVLRHSGVYTRWTQRLTNLFGMAGISSPEAVANEAQRVGDAVPARDRARAIADDIVSASVGPGKTAPKWLADHLRLQIPRFVAERAATGLPTVVAALRDIGAGKPLDEAFLKSRLSELDAIARDTDRQEHWPTWDSTDRPAQSRVR